MVSMLYGHIDPTLYYVPKYNQLQKILHSLLPNMCQKQIYPSNWACMPNILWKYIGNICVTCEVTGINHVTRSAVQQYCQWQHHHFLNAWTAIGQWVKLAKNEIKEALSKDVVIFLTSLPMISGISFILSLNHSYK